WKDSRNEVLRSVATGVYENASSVGRFSEPRASELRETRLERRELAPELFESTALALDDLGRRLRDEVGVAELALDARDLPGELLALLLELRALLVEVDDAEHE